MSNPPINRIQQAQQLFRGGDPGSARQLLHSECRENPANAHAWFLLGVCDGAQGYTSAAIEHLSHALTLNPGFVGAHYNLAVALHRAGDLHAAADACRRAIDLQPLNPAYHHELGSILALQERHAEAAAEFQAALDHAGPSPQLLDSLGTVQLRQGQYGEALENFTRAQSLRPDFAMAQAHMAEALLHLGRSEEAVASAQKAIQMEPGSFYACKVLGEALIGLDRFEEVISCLDAYADSFSGEWDYHLIIGRAFLELGQEDRARECFNEALRLNPGSGMTRYYLDQIDGNMSSQSAAAGFVRDIFDKYADHFDEHLVGALQYKVPWLLNDLLRELLQPQPDSLDVLDLGCGTGLCGPLLDDISRYMVGIDLSPRMIEKARQLDVYDQLIAGEIVEEMQGMDHAFDLVVAADVFVYIRDLGPVFSQVARVTKPAGNFVFTVELADNEGSGPRSSGRVVHELSYIRDLAGASGFREVAAREDTLRREGSHSVRGVIMVLCKD